MRSNMTVSKFDVIAVTEPIEPLTRPFNFLHLYFYGA